uniref:Small integral membrane protein 8 n=1 Tax=Eptatretus burgeri TaxID=7764 RepID=A0A8C4QX97_EPTBU
MISKAGESQKPVSHAESESLKASVDEPLERRGKERLGLGLRGARTTTLFRAINPELFIKPNKVVMVLGLAALSFCAAYLGYLHATTENAPMRNTTTNAETSSRQASKWD